jgi:hypothetical protein
VRPITHNFASRYFLGALPRLASISPTRFREPFHLFDPLNRRALSASFTDFRGRVYQNPAASSPEYAP